MSLGVDLEDTRTAHLLLKQQEHQQEAGQDVTLLFNLPAGDSSRVRFKMGHTIAFVKLELQKLYGYPMDKQVLKMQGRVLIDPFTIADYPVLSSGPEISIDIAMVQ